MLLIIMSFFSLYNEDFTPSGNIPDGEAIHLRCRSLLLAYQQGARNQNLNLVEKDLCSYELYFLLPQYA